MSRLKNKTVLITGAAQGIGAAIAEAMAREGAHVIVSDINEPLLRLTAQRLGAQAMVLDVREEGHWEAAMRGILAEHGRLHVLVNNAGITGLEQGAVHDPEHASLDDWRHVHATNLDGVFLGCKHALRAMRQLPRGEHGSIVNISSRSGIVGVPAAAAYASSKAAVRNHTKTVALYCAEQRLPVRCNSIHPAAILTPMWEPILGTGPIGRRPCRRWWRIHHCADSAHHRKWPAWPCFWRPTSRPTLPVQSSMSTGGSWLARRRYLGSNSLYWLVIGMGALGWKRSFAQCSTIVHYRPIAVVGKY